MNLHPWHLVVIAALWASPVGAQEPSAELRVALAEARTLVDQGKPRAAIDKLQALDQPRRPEVAHLLGVAYYHADEPLRAIELLNGVREKLPEGSLEQREAVQVLGLSYYLAGRFAEAIPFLEATRAWAGHSLELGYVLGLSYIQTHQPDRAREALAPIFQVPVTSAAAHLLTAQMMIRLELEPLAETELKRALEKDAQLPQANLLLGQLAIFRGKFEEGLAFSERELAINPGNAMAFYQLGDAYVRQSKWEEGIVALQKSIWLNPYYSGPYILLGKAYMKKAQPATAEGMLKRAIEYDPNNKSAHYLLGQLLQQTGRIEEARREFDIAERLQGQPGR